MKTAGLVRLTNFNALPSAAFEIRVSLKKPDTMRKCRVCLAIYSTNYLEGLNYC